TDTVEITAKRDPTARQSIENPFMEQLSITPEQIQNMPGNANLEKVISNMAGGTTSEFSSQYRIRGGNFDENLIYINGVRIYRPQLIRAGMQEGLPVTNSDLVGSVAYSAGGFSAQYGDKMSSVLDITYREPDDFAASVELGILNQYVHVEGSAGRDPENNSDIVPGKFTYLMGARRLDLSYAFNFLDTDGNYRPLSMDGQGFFTYTPKHQIGKTKLRERKDGSIDSIYLPNAPLKFSLLSFTSYNNFRFEPQSRETTFGTVQQAFRLFVGFVGEEQTRYLSNQGAFVVDWQPSLRFKNKFILSGYRSDEDELFSVEGGYRLSDVNTNLGNEDFNEETFTRGIGTQIRWARNFLTIYTASAAWQGELALDRDFYRKAADDYVKHKLNFGLRAQREWIYDELFEWNALDSAEYVNYGELILSQNEQLANRFMGHLQYSWRTSKTTNLNIGGRANYWTQNEQLLISPRVQFAYHPGERDSSKLWNLRFAAGLYQQPPFYRELRAFDGTLFPDLQAQRSYHFVAGGDWTFFLWQRPFKLTGEAYYKHLEALIPYEFENVRIRYYPTERADGRIYGTDLKLNGQFIEGVDSYFRLSYMKAEENVRSLPEQGYVPRPTDQRVMFSMFFQDHLPRVRNFKAHINLVYGSGLPHGPPQTLDNRTGFRQPHYSRVDLGLSYLLAFRTDEERGAFSLKSLWISLEVFNLLQRQNTISYNWITDAYGNRFAIPNYLSNRFLNLRLVGKF
ncbi:MAG: TonB-dependent receptor plug domain-containing protein, partial [Bacteroidota bacterium]